MKKALTVLLLLIALGLGSGCHTVAPYLADAYYYGHGGYYYGHHGHHGYHGGYCH
jgi:hypothetical protein